MYWWQHDKVTLCREDAHLTEYGWQQVSCSTVLEVEYSLAYSPQAVFVAAYHPIGRSPEQAYYKFARSPGG